MSLENFTPDLSRPASTEQLARALGIATDIFNFVVETDDPTKLYRRHLIPKKATPKLPSVPIIDSDGIVALSLPTHELSQYRVVWEPMTNVVKFAHRSAAQVLERFLTRPGSTFPHPSAFGYIKGRSTRKNAQRHAGARFLMSADIHNFFPSISTARVEIALCDAGLNRKVAGQLARFLSIEGALPLGLNSSPLIANLVAHPLDADLQALAESVGCAYTRYADDITFSSMAQLPSRDVLEGLLRKHRFKLNGSKLRASKRGQKHYVTGLSVDDKDHPHAPRRLKRRLRQELHFIEKYGLANHISRLKIERTRQHEINRIDGTVSYIASIEPRLSSKLRARWAAICEREEIERSFEPRPTTYLRQASWFVDEAILERPDGTKLLAICLADVLDPDRLALDLIRLFEDEAGDAFGTSSAIAIIKKGIHWVDATWSQREKVVNLIATSPIRAMVAFGQLNQGQYQALYSQLLRRVLETAMKTSDDAVVSLVVEANSAHISSKLVRDAVQETHLSLEARNQRRPMAPPTVVIEAKGALPAMCVPDVLLGALGKYAMCKPVEKAAGGLIVSLFERLRNRYSVIFDDHLGAIYHSGNPFRRWRTGA